MSKAGIQKKDNKRASGIEDLQDGSSIIPSSVRPDGSIRSERKVRPGYIPPEDISVYRVVHHVENRQGMNFICSGTQMYSFNGTMAFSNLSKSAKKRAKQKEKILKLKNSNEYSELKTKDSLLVDDIERSIQNLKIEEIQKSETCFKNQKASVSNQNKRNGLLDNGKSTLESSQT